MSLLCCAKLFITMIQNLGNADRIIRILVALAMAALYFFGVISGTTAVILLIISAVFVATGFIGFCPIYTLFRIKTTSGH